MHLWKRQYNRHIKIIYFQTEFSSLESWSRDDSRPSFQSWSRSWTNESWIQVSFICINGNLDFNLIQTQIGYHGVGLKIYDKIISLSSSSTFGSAIPGVRHSRFFTNSKTGSALTFWHFTLLILLTVLSLTVILTLTLTFCIYKALCVLVCPLKTRERVGRLSPNFWGSSRAPRGWFVDEKS